MKKKSNNTDRGKDPFLQRAIEYWLDSANELGYQPLFCEWLISKGYILKYSIKNTNFEQGKDVLAVASNGIPHAYQLKGGNINLKRWRMEVRPEIEAMIDCAIQHPDINKNTSHISYLVTNGEIEDATRSEIVALNEGKWKKTPLHVWTRGDLLSGFLNMAEGILPKDAQTYKDLIDLIFTDGTALPDIPKINKFLSQILNIDTSLLKKEQRRRDIAGAMLYATMIAGPSRKVENHDTTVQIMTLLLSLIFYVVDKYELEDTYWLESYKIIWNDIVTSSRLLESEINVNGFESAFTSPFDTDLINFRKHSAASIIYALKASEFVNGHDEWKNVLDANIFSKYVNSIMPWGEASFIPLILIICIFKNSKETELIALDTAQAVISIILHMNGRNSKHSIGLLPPYYNIDFVLKLRFDAHDEKFEDKYKFSSYLLKPFIEIMVRLKGKEYIVENWREISFMHFEEFIPENKIDYYLWRAPKGENRSIIPKKQTSWSDLEQQSNKYDGRALPLTLKRFPAFIPFFLSVFPHRANSEVIAYLYRIST